MKIILKLRKYFFIVLIPVLCSACLTNVEEPLIDDPTTANPCETITYTLSIKPIMDANCVQCHSAGGNFPNLSTYNGVSANAASVKAETVSRRMPQGGSLTSAEIEAISCWVDAGAINN